jgi:hypothetical protein
MNSKQYTFANQVNFTIKCAHQAIASEDISNFHKYGYHADRLLKLLKTNNLSLHPNKPDAERIHIALRTISFTARTIEVNNLPVQVLSGIRDQLLKTPASPTN